MTQARASQQAQLAQIEASLSQMHAQVAAATVTAPCDGLIVGVNITAGGIAAPSGPAILLSEGGRTRVSVQVSEDLLGQLKVGDIAEVTVSARFLMCHLGFDCLHCTGSQCADGAL